MSALLYLQLTPLKKASTCWSCYLAINLCRVFNNVLAVVFNHGLLCVDKMCDLLGYHFSFCALDASGLLAIGVHM